MKYTFQIRISPNEEDDVFEILCRKLGLSKDRFGKISILKKSIDARKKPEITYLYTFELQPKGKDVEKILKKRGAKEAEEKVSYLWPSKKECAERPVIIGFGPAGIYAAYYLALAGLRPIVLERGNRMEERIEDVKRFHKTGELRTNSNVQFGEGGAGTFSDGKLNTGVKDKCGRNRAVLDTFVRFGAPEEILYDGRAHIGTDVIRNVVVNIRKEIESLGGEVRFGCRFIRPETDGGKLVGITYEKLAEPETGEIYLPCKNLILAIGHSSRDTYETLYSMDFSMKAKPFAVGFRVIHEAELINESQYGREYRKNYPDLPAAYYKLATTTSSGRNVYSFCMCPGGYVVDASSEEGRLAVNGMSYAARDGMFSNGAIVMNVSEKDFGESVLDGIRFQRELEEKAFRLGGGRIPVEFYKDFAGEAGNSPEYARYKEEHAGEYGGYGADTTGESDGYGDTHIGNFARYGIEGNVRKCDLTELMTPAMKVDFIEGMEYFNTCIHGFTDSNPLLAGIESRTSAPLRILRDENFEAVGIQGIYPCGEGAGYAGGITSAAMDGLKCAEAVYKKILGGS